MEKFVQNPAGNMTIDAAARLVVDMVLFLEATAQDSE